ncbi:MAG: toll/interleukin-1 receptor domain-containing protein [Verrucomicrobia bacterium]|nr:toll/interleukin-1 receptor domain-containing protein [Verrucomicrobiota bacterium]
MSPSPVPVAPAAENGASADAPEAPRYRAFISYSHTDTKWATWLLKKLEGYRVPARFHGRAAPIGRVGGRIAPIFRDRDELPTADDLGEAVQAALQQSATLIVICSPAAARSRWVNEEAMSFKRLDRADRVFAFIVEGEPNASEPAQECFPPALRFALAPDGRLSPRPVELIAADAREHGDGREDAFIRLVAGLLGVGFDDLRRREHARRMRRMIWVTAGSVAGMALTIGLAAMAWVRSEDAKRRLEGQEQLMTRLLDGLDARIKRAERLDELDGEIESAMAYFRSLNPRDLTDAMLAKQAKGLTQMGEVRAKQLRLKEADEALAAAIERLTELTQRHPKNGDMLFERAQAEFWIGNQHRRGGDIAKAGGWLTRYRDSAAALAVLAPANLKWRQEAVYAQSNLSVLEMDRGHLVAAQEGFMRALAARRALAVEPGEARLWEFGISNNVSFLGTVAERAGDLPTAQARYAEHTGLLEALVAREPTNPRWQERLAYALALQATIDEITGAVDRALAKRTRALAMLEPLLAQDPTNRVWVLTQLRIEARLVPILRTTGDTAGAARVLAAALARVGRLGEAAATETTVAKVVLAVRRGEAEHRLAVGEPGAGEAVQVALKIGGEQLAKDPGNIEILVDQLRACVVAGHIAAKAGDTVAAQRHWARVLELAGTRATESRYWALLDSVARACAQLDRAEESRGVVARLQQLGYRPVESWPASLNSRSATNQP